MRYEARWGEGFVLVDSSPGTTVYVAEVCGTLSDGSLDAPIHVESATALGCVQALVEACHFCAESRHAGRIANAA